MFYPLFTWQVFKYLKLIRFSQHIPFPWPKDIWLVVFLWPNYIWHTFIYVLWSLLKIIIFLMLINLISCLHPGLKKKCSKYVSWFFPSTPSKFWYEISRKYCTLYFLLGNSHYRITCLVSKKPWSKVIC